jgi:nucleoside phosphorylase
MPPKNESGLPAPAGSREWFDIILIVPLEEELLTLMEVFPPTLNRSTDRTFRYEIDVGQTNFRALVVQQEGMGRTHAARAVSETLAEFDTGLIICLGIAGSLTSDLRLGDVCYSNNIADVLDNARAVDNDAGQLDLALSLTYFNTPREIVAAFNFSRILPELQPTYKEWQSRQKEALSELNFSALLLIEVSSVIAHRATEALLNVDFSLVKKDFQSDPVVIKALREVRHCAQHVIAEFKNGLGGFDKRA